MNMETPAPDAKRPPQKDKPFLKQQVDRCSRTFNALSARVKKTGIVVFGISMAGICITLIVQAISGHSITTPPKDEITLPNNIYRNYPQTERLIPIGKMNGEMNGVFETFHVALDHQGQLFINRNPGFSTDSLNRSKGWEPITPKQLETFEKHLHFIPTQQSDLKR